MDRRELRRPHDVEVPATQGEIVRSLVLIHVGRLGGVPYIPGAEAEVSHAGEGRAGVERSATAVDLDETAGRRLAVRVQEVLGRLVGVSGRLLVVVVVPLERQPVE